MIVKPVKVIDGLTSATTGQAHQLSMPSMFHVVDKPVIYIRGNITTLTKTGVNNVTVTAQLVYK